MKEFRLSCIEARQLLEIVKDGPELPGNKSIELSISQLFVRLNSTRGFQPF
jgi:hypothetical protein